MDRARIPRTGQSKQTCDLQAASPCPRRHPSPAPWPLIGGMQQPLITRHHLDTRHTQANIRAVNLPSRSFTVPSVGPYYALLKALVLSQLRIYQDTSLKRCSNSESRREIGTLVRNNHNRWEALRILADILLLHSSHHYCIKSSGGEIIAVRSGHVSPP